MPKAETVDEALEMSVEEREAALSAAERTRLEGWDRFVEGLEILRPGQLPPVEISTLRPEDPPAE